MVKNAGIRFEFCTVQGTVKTFRTNFELITIAMFFTEKFYILEVERNK